MTQPENDDAWVGRTFDDFLIRPQLGLTESRRDTALTCRLTTALSIELPIVSANMDSVTGWEMAQAMALEGGVGIIHRALPIDHQAEMVRRVKRSYGAVFETHYGDGNGELDDAVFDTPAEGQEIQVPYKGAVADILLRVRGHLRSAVSYAGETSLEAARRESFDR